MRENGFGGFPPAALRFLADLKGNNNREWFLANKGMYDTQVRAPMIELLTALQPALRRFAPEIVYEPSRSVFRIYRDVRFSADKSPYKTHIAAHLSPKLPSTCSTAGLYLHIDPGQAFVAGGLYHPPSPELRATRHHVAENHTALRRIVRNPSFTRRFGELGGAKLSRAPRGFPPEHPAGDFLRYKDFIVSVTRPAEIALTQDFYKLIVEHFRAMMPLIRFLNTGLRSVSTRFRPDDEI